MRFQCQLLGHFPQKPSFSTSLLHSWRLFFLLPSASYLHAIMSQPNSVHPFTKVSHKKPYAAISPSNPSLSAEGKTIVITGGSEGIGYAIVAAFAAAGAANIIILSRRAEMLEEAKKNIAQEYHNTRIHTFPASIDDAEKVFSVFADIRAHIAEPDILILCAARGHMPAPTLIVPVDSLWKDFEINVKGNLNVVTEFLRPETLVKEKKIINVSTTAAHQHIPGMSGYGASKEAFVHILMDLQEEHADRSVRITSYHPGAILTSGAKSLGFDKYPIAWEDGEWLSVVYLCGWCTLTPMSSQPCWPIRSLACVQGGRLSGRPIRIRELGR